MLNKNITRLRRSRGLTQVEFAKLIHVTQSAVSHWESGRSVPDTLQLFRIAEFFGVTVEALNATQAEQEAKLPAHEEKPDQKENPRANDLAEAEKILKRMTPETYEKALALLRILDGQ